MDQSEMGCLVHQMSWKNLNTKRKPNACHSVHYTDSVFSVHFVQVEFIPPCALYASWIFFPFLLSHTTSCTQFIPHHFLAVVFFSNHFLDFLFGSFPNSCIHKYRRSKKNTERCRRKLLRFHSNSTNSNIRG